LDRLLWGLFHELLALVKRNQVGIAHSAFKATIAHLGPTALAAWKAIEHVGLGSPSTSPHAQALVRVRNTVSYHYDAKDLLRGYARAFNSTTGRVPYASRGRSLQASRFYFADAAAHECLLAAAPQDATLSWEGDFIRNANRALHNIVEAFIYERTPRKRRAKKKTKKTKKTKKRGR
jgi:hypothetical protein